MVLNNMKHDKDNETSSSFFRSASSSPRSPIECKKIIHPWITKKMQEKCSDLRNSHYTLLSEMEIAKLNELDKETEDNIYTVTLLAKQLSARFQLYCRDWDYDNESSSSFDSSEAKRLNEGKADSKGKEGDTCCIIS